DAKRQPAASGASAQSAGGAARREAAFVPRKEADGTRAAHAGLGDLFGAWPLGGAGRRPSGAGRGQSGASAAAANLKRALGAAPAAGRVPPGGRAILKELCPVRFHRV